MKRAVLCFAVAGLAVVISSQWQGFQVGFFANPTSAQQKPVEVKIDPKTFDDYAGQYAFAENPDLVLSFFREGDTYYVQASGQGRIQIFPASASKFFVKI